MTPEKRRRAADLLFADEASFEKHALDIRDAADRKEVIGILVEEILRGPLRGTLHFSELSSYDDLRIDGIARAILERLVNEAVGYLEENLRFSKALAVEAIHERGHLLLLKRLSLFYFRRYGPLFFAAIADSFFEKVAALSSAEHPPKLLLQAFEGTKKYPSLVKGRTPTFTLLWKHTREANRIRRREIEKVQLALASIVNHLEGEQTFSDEERQSLEARYQKNMEALEKIRREPLDTFDVGLRQIKKSALEVLSGIAEQ